MFEIPKKYSKEEIAEMEKQRTLNDAELLKDGASYAINEEDEKRLDLTEEQKKKAQEDQDKIEEIRRKIAGEPKPKQENLDRLSAELKEAEKISREEILDASCSGYGVKGYKISELKLLNEEDGVKDAIKIATGVLADENSLRLFLLGNFSEKIKIELDVDNDEMLRSFLKFPADFVFDSKKLKSENLLGDTLKNYATEYFQTKYALELQKKAKVLIKNFIPEAFKDFSAKFKFIFLGHGVGDSHMRYKDYDEISSGYNRRYKETGGIPNMDNMDKGFDLLAMTHEYSHGIFDRILDPDRKITSWDIAGDVNTIYRSLSEGFCLFVQDFVAKEVEKEQELIRANPELEGMIKNNKKRFDEMEQEGEDEHPYYKEGIAIVKKIFETDGLEGIVNFIKSVDPAKSIEIKRDNPIYQEAIQTENPYKLLEIIGKK